MSLWEEIKVKKCILIAKMCRRDYKHFILINKCEREKRKKIGISVLFSDGWHMTVALGLFEFRLTFVISEEEV